MKLEYTESRVLSHKALQPTPYSVRSASAPHIKDATTQGRSTMTMSAQFADAASVRTDVWMRAMMASPLRELPPH